MLPNSVLPILFLDCLPPVPPVNGLISGYSNTSNTSEGALIDFQCNDGYVPTAPVTSICNLTEGWMPPPHLHQCDIITGMYQTN